MIFRFNQFCIDTRRFQIEHDGETVTTEPLAFALLVYLIRNRDRVVARDELLDELWPGKFVTESALNARLKIARKVIGDSGSRQELIKTFHGRGYQFIVDVEEFESQTATPSAVTSEAEFEPGLSQQSPVRFCRAHDGINIAHTQIGAGPPLIMTGSWITHLEEDWSDPAWGKFLSDLARDFTLIRYDVRGNGMSDWDDVEISFSNLVADLNSIVNSYNHEQVSIFAPSASAAVSIAYTIDHPEKVSRLVLYGGYVQGCRQRGDPGAIAESKAMATLIRQAWGRGNPVARQMMTTLYTPEASQEEADAFNELQRICGPAENIARFREVYDDIDVSDLLDKVSSPTLVIHCVGDSISPYSQGKLLASNIADASFISLNSNQHLLSGNDLEYPRLIHRIREFLLPK